MTSKREAILCLSVVPPKNRISGKYIVLEASLGPSDLTPMIQGLLSSSRTSWWFLQGPTSLSSRGLAELISYRKSLSQSCHQLLDSRNFFCPSEIGAWRLHMNSILDKFISEIIRNEISNKFYGEHIFIWCHHRVEYWASLKIVMQGHISGNSEFYHNKGDFPYYKERGKKSRLISFVCWVWSKSWPSVTDSCCYRCHWNAELILHKSEGHCISLDSSRHGFANLSWIKERNPRKK
jgi:hypothetical protein